jgi:hypothetical protein
MMIDCRLDAPQFFHPLATFPYDWMQVVVRSPSGSSEFTPRWMAFLSIACL